MTALLLPLLCLLPAPAPQGEPLLVKAGTLVVAPDTVLAPGQMLLRDGKVAMVGQDLPADATAPARVLELDGWVVPGFVDPHSHLSRGGDLAERTSPVTPELRAADAFDPFDPLLRLHARCGVLTLGLAPVSANPFAGSAAVVKATEPGELWPDAGYVKISLVAEALDAERPPTSRMGALELVRRELATARLAAAEGSPRLAALRDVVAGASRLFVHARTHAEITAALDLAESLPVAPVLLGADAVRASLPRVKALGGSVVLAPLTMRDRAEALALPAALEQAGIGLAFFADRPPGIAAPPARAEAQGLWPLLEPFGTPPPPAGAVPAPGHPEALRLSAALAVAHGLSRPAALAALTRTPAMLLGVEARAGTLREGRDADFVHWSGDPLDLTSRLHAVYVRGARLPDPTPAGDPTR